MTRLQGWSKTQILCLLWLAAAIGAPAQTFTTLVSFNGSDGANPSASLILARDGNFYGTTENGGSNGSGTVFKISPSGVFTTVYSFCAQTNCEDGRLPESAVVQGIDGNFYGTTTLGGANGQGTVFQLTPDGQLTRLYSFCAPMQCLDGSQPNSLVQGKDGDFYGTTSGGGVLGTINCDGDGCGTVFKITPAGALTTLHTFCAQGPGEGLCADGATPLAGLVQATDGNFYGVTSLPAVCETPGSCNNGGTIFQITPSGDFSTIYTFCAQAGCPDGNYPVAALIEATDGNLYGTTYTGGANQGGTIFKTTLAGALTTLYFFCLQQSCPDGSFPRASLVQAIDGYFYTTAYAGGANGSGSIVAMTPQGALTTVYSFCHSPCGEGPYGGLVQGTDGTFYGTTYYGGNNLCDGGCGTVFSFVALPVSTFSPVSVNFGDQPSGLASSPVPVTLKNTGGAPLLISSIADTGDFSQSNNCPTAPATLSIGQSCTISIIFTPAGAGTESDTLIVTDNAAGSPHQIPLTGIGQTPFQLSTNCTNLSVVPGQTASCTVALTPARGFTKSVSLSCSGAPALAACNVKPSMITLDGSTAVQATVTATTTPATSSLLQPASQKNNSHPLEGLIALGGMTGLASLVMLPRKRNVKTARQVGLIFCLCLLSSSVTMSSCGGGSEAGAERPGTAAGTYPLTVTATFQSSTGAALTEKVSFNLVVQ